MIKSIDEILRYHNSDLAMLNECCLDEDDEFLSSLQKSTQKKPLKHLTLTNEGRTFVTDKIQLSALIMAFDELEVLRAEDWSPSDGECTVSVLVNMSSTFADDEDGEYLEKLDIYRYENHYNRRLPVAETHYEIPNEISSIPGIDAESALKMFTDGEFYQFEVAVNYKTDYSYYHDDFSNETTKVPLLGEVNLDDVIIHSSEEEKSIMDFLDEEAKKILLEVAEDYLQENFDTLQEN